MTELLDKLSADLRGEFERALNRLRETADQHEKTAAGLAIENKLLKEELRLMRIEKYGSRSEKLTDNQLELLELEPGVQRTEVEAEAERGPLPEPPVRKPRRHPGRTEFPEHLERVETIVPCTPEQCRCSRCGGEKKVIGYEESQELDVIPAKYFVKVTKREKRVCPQCEEEGVKTAPAPVKIIEKGRFSNQVVIDVLVNKYCDHQPLYRQSASIMRETGLEVSRMTLCNSVMYSGWLLEAVVREMREEVLRGSYIQADETPVGVQSKKTVGRNHRGYLWEFGLPGSTVVFDFRMGRGREGPVEFLKDFNGILQCDGYQVYNSIGSSDITLAGCMTHARRGFSNLSKLSGHKDLLATEILAEFSRLYDVETEARANGMSHAERLALRQEKSVPILTGLKERILNARKAALPGGALAKACDYTLGQWEKLLVYTRHGEVEIDNNLCENAIRGVAIGRKNWLHIGSEKAGPRVAAVMSVMETCRRIEVNVREYLSDILPGLAERPASEVRDLTPVAWAAARSKS